LDFIVITTAFIIFSEKYNKYPIGLYMLLTSFIMLIIDGYVNMRIIVNEREMRFREGAVLDMVRTSVKPDADVMVLNGFPGRPTTPVREGDRVVLIRKGEIPPISELEALMMARHSPGVHERLKSSTVGIAGVGGLGSHVALALARSGVGRLVIVDHDVVEPSNLNRQEYCIDHLGMKKVHAMEQVLLRANPFVAVEAHDLSLDEESAKEVFRDCDVVVECLDDATMKAELISAVLSGLPGARVVAASGLAGSGPANDIVTRRHDRLYICGDGKSGIGPGVGLLATRVMVCAGHQANQVVRLLLGEID
jgi:sulfur carrier protein ThiS adenylyltransferase